MRRPLDLGQGTHVRALSIVLILLSVSALGGCLGARPERGAVDAPGEQGEDAGPTGTINITFRRPRDVYGESYEYRLVAIAPDGNVTEGTSYQRFGFECEAPECVVRDEGTTGSFVPNGRENGSPYDYLMTARVRYLGIWTMTIEEVLYRDYMPRLNERETCSYLAFNEPNKMPDESSSTLVGYPERFPECLDPGTYRVDYDGKVGILIAEE